MYLVEDLLYADPAQPLRTAGEEPDDVDHDLSDLSDLSDPSVRGVKLLVISVDRQPFCRSLAKS